MPDGAPSIELSQLAKDYGEGSLRTRVLHEIDLVVPRGQLLAIVGPSGSGKSSLLNLLGLLDRPTSGSLRLAGRETSGLGDDERTRIRGELLGFVFQFHHLLPALTAEENVAMPRAVLSGRIDTGARAKARAALCRLGIAELAARKPSEMSGGQRQRVAIARALVGEPSVVLADEPTGNLDTESSEAVFGEIRRLNRELGLTFVVVTHDAALAARCDRVVELVDGRVKRDVTR